MQGWHLLPFPAPCSSLYALLESWDPHDCNRESTLISCPLTSMEALWLKCTHTDTYTFKKILNGKNNLRTGRIIIPRDTQTFKQGFVSKLLQEYGLIVSESSEYTLITTFHGVYSGHIVWSVLLDSYNIKFFDSDYSKFFYNHYQNLEILSKKGSILCVIKNPTKHCKWYIYFITSKIKDNRKKSHYYGWLQCLKTFISSQTSTWVIILI